MRIWGCLMIDPIHFDRITIESVDLPVLVSYTPILLRLPPGLLHFLHPPPMMHVGVVPAATPLLARLRHEVVLVLEPDLAQALCLATPGFAGSQV